MKRRLNTEIEFNKIQDSYIEYREQQCPFPEKVSKHLKSIIK